MSSNDIAIRVENLSKKFTLQHAVKDEYGNDTRELWALKDVSFEIKKGESVGIIGPNGSGKSTLLKILAGVTKPTSGKVEIYGKVASILDIGAGFHPELSGRENVFLNGQLLDFSKKEIQSKFEEIVDFSGIEKFIDEPVKNYSNGMYLRLAFSIMAHLDFDVYLFDEVFSVGDAEFRQKSFRKIRHLKQVRSKTILLITHTLNDLSNSNKIFYTHEGYLELLPSKSDAIRKYFSSTELFTDMMNPLFIDKTANLPTSECIENIELKLFNKRGVEKDEFISNEEIVVEIKLFGLSKQLNLGVCLRNDQGISLLEISHLLDDKFLYPNEKNQRLMFSFPYRFFNQGNFFIDIVLFNDGGVTTYISNVRSFSVKIEEKFKGTIYENTWGMIKPFFKWEISKF